MFESGDGDQIQILNFSDIETQLISENTAVIAYVIELGILNEKQKSSMKRTCTSTWIKENDAWL